LVFGSLESPVADRRSFAGSVKALVVDDNIDAANTLAYLLRLNGCKAAVAFGGEMAVRTARLLQPHLAFIDLVLPGIDGYEVLRRMREQGSAPTLAVALTGHWDAQCVARCREGGFDRFVEKPMSPATLGVILQECEEQLSASTQETPATGVPAGTVADAPPA
jgi:CheY-like chemotaxis protein